MTNTSLSPRQPLHSFPEPGQEPKPRGQCTAITAHCGQWQGILWARGTRGSTTLTPQCPGARTTVAELKQRKEEAASSSGLRKGWSARPLLRGDTLWPSLRARARRAVVCREGTRAPQEGRYMRRTEAQGSAGSPAAATRPGRQEGVQSRCGAATGMAPANQRKNHTHTPI